MTQVRWTLTAACWLPVLSAASLLGCGQNEAPSAHSTPSPAAGVTSPIAAKGAAALGPAAALVGPGAALSTVPVAVAAAVSAPAPAPERAWDPCSALDPNPWPWRSEAEGMWGENPLLVPSFTLKQERRAPKMPDADRYLKTLGHTVERTALHNALLICQVETYSRNGLQPTLYQYKLQPPTPTRNKCGADWDAMNGPDVLVRLRLRDEYPVALFGPEDHWGFFVSIPRVNLAVGDTISAKLWDRDSGTYWNGYVNERKNEFMGAATIKFDGSLPFTLHAAYFSLRCNAMKAPQARGLAQSWLEQLDRPLKAGSAWHPDAQRWDFGLSTATESVESDFGRGNFRYPAGFLGWEAPEIQSRLQLVKDQSSNDARQSRAFVGTLLHKAPPATSGVQTLDGGRGSIRFESALCRRGECEVRAQVGTRALKDLCTQGVAKNLLRAAGIDESGKFAGAFAEIEKEGAWQSCAGEPILAKEGTTAVRIKLLGAPQLLWLGGVGKAIIVKLPAS